MTGDQSDMVARLKAALPPTWFPNSPGASPVLDGLLNGIASVWAWTYSFLQFVRQQARITTASGIFLDMIAVDFFGRFIRRRVNETDTGFRWRIKRELFRPKGTRAGLISALTDLTGRAPWVFEPANTGDTGGYGTSGQMGYGVAGGYGSLVLPYQFFVIPYRPLGVGVAGVAGYGSIGGYNGMTGGYGVGAIEYVSPAMFVAPVTDQDILDTINDVRPAGTIAWTSIRS